MQSWMEGAVAVPRECTLQSHGGFTWSALKAPSPSNMSPDLDRGCYA